MAMLAVIALLSALAIPPPSGGFDPATDQARQTAAVKSLQAVSERRAVAQQARRRAAAAKPKQVQARKREAAIRARTPEGRMEAQADRQRSAAQPGVRARARALDRKLYVQPDVTGEAQAAHVEAVERQARSEARKMAAENAPPR